MGDQTLFLDFFTNNFMHHITIRPCVLLYDGHSTHVFVDVIEASMREDVHLCVLLPHTSQCLKLLALTMFSPFKKNLSSECHNFFTSQSRYCEGRLSTDNWHCF